MRRDDDPVTAEDVKDLKELANWAEENVDAPKRLHGSKEFRRVWSRFGVENALYVTSLWEGARSEHDRAGKALDEARAEVESLKRLDHDQVSSPAALGDDFPLLRARLDKAKEVVRHTRNRLKEINDHSDESLAEGQEKLAALERVLAARSSELNNLRAVTKADLQDVHDLEAANKALAAKRDELQVLIEALDERLGR